MAKLSTNMQYNDTTNLNGIIQEVERYINMGSTWISGDTTRLKEFTSYANKIGHKIWHWIFLAQGLWRYDDSNATDLPEGTTALVSSQRTYALPSDSLTVRRVEIKDSAGNWDRISQLVEDDIEGAISEYQEDNGTPQHYRLVGNTIELFPAPSYSQAASLRVYFDRSCVDFAYDDTTQTPGFASPYHEAVPVGMAIEWLKIKNPTSQTLQFLREEWARFEKEITDFYSMRNKDVKTVLKPSERCYK